MDKFQDLLSWSLTIVKTNLGSIMQQMGYFHTNSLAQQIQEQYKKGIPI